MPSDTDDQASNADRPEQRREQQFDGLDATKGRAYMEIGRKEASLADVDRELSGVVRRFAEATAS